MRQKSIVMYCRHIIPIPISLRHICLRSSSATPLAEKSLTFSPSSMKCFRLRVRVFPYEARDPQACSVLLLHRTWDWWPLTFYHFLLINWVQESHLFWDSLWRVLLRTHPMTPWSIESVCQPWLSRNSFVCQRWEYSCRSVLWGVVKSRHSSQGHCRPHKKKYKSQASGWTGNSYADVWRDLTHAQLTQFPLCCLILYERESVSVPQHVFGSECNHYILTDICTGFVAAGL